MRYQRTGPDVAGALLPSSREKVKSWLARPTHGERALAPGRLGIAVHARAIGFAVVSPRRLRPLPESGWSGAAAFFETLTRELDPTGVFAR